MNRYYDYKGLQLPSVTTVCSQLNKPALVQWAANCACDSIYEQIDIAGRKRNAEIDIDKMINIAKYAYKKISKQALLDGSKVHNSIEKYLINKKEPKGLNDASQNAFNAFKKWFSEYKIDVIETEKTVHNTKLGYAGTLDLKCLYKNKIYIMDWKTSKDLYPEHRYQIAAYKACDSTVEGTAILCLNKTDGTFKFKDTTKFYENDVKVFKILIDLFFQAHPKIKKKAGR